MSRETLPCIICDKSLVNVHEDSYNQPEDAIAFWTWGHYGTTVFDPEDGQNLEINICDSCLLNKARDGRIYLGRTHRLILCEGTIVGREKLGRPLVLWDGENHGGTDFEVDVLHVSPEEVGKALSPNIEWLGSIARFYD